MAILKKQPEKQVQVEAEKPEPKTEKRTFTTLSMESFARETANKTEETNLGEDIETFLAGKDAAKRGSLLVYFDLHETFGDELLDWPVYGSKEGETGNRRFDRYETRVGNETVSTSFYAELVKRTSWGAKLWHTVTQLRLAAGEGKAQCEEPYVSMVPHHVETNKKKYEARFAAAKSVIGQAVALSQKLEEIKQLKELEVVFDTIEHEGEEILADTTSPIILRERKKTHNFEIFSVGRFLKIDVEAAIAGGGTTLAVIKTLRKGKKDKEKSTSIVLNTMDEVHSYATALFAFLGDKKAYAKFLTACERKDGDEYVIAMGDLAEMTDAFMTKFRSRYERLKEDRADKE